MTATVANAKVADLKETRKRTDGTQQRNRRVAHRGK